MTQPLSASCVTELKALISSIEEAQQREDTLKSARLATREHQRMQDKWMQGIKGFTESPGLSMTHYFWNKEDAASFASARPACVAWLLTTTMHEKVKGSQSEACSVETVMNSLEDREIIHKLATEWLSTSDDPTG